MTPKAPLLTEQRRRNVLDLVDQDGQVTVADLVKRFSISAVTVRTDLDALASVGAVVRSHGGAVRRLEATQDYPLRMKETLHREEKVRIGRAAAELVKPGETIILDSGTTTAEIARHLKRVKIQSLTRSEEHTSELQSRGHLVCRLLLEKKKKYRQAHSYLSNYHHFLERHPRHQYLHSFPTRRSSDLMKETLHREEKVRIGRAAAELVKPGETIILDSGTTTAEIARHLKRVKIQSLT